MLKENTKIHYKNIELNSTGWTWFVFIFLFLIYNTLWYLIIILIICQLILKRYQFECTLFLSSGELKKATLTILLAKVKLFLGNYL